MKTCDNNCYPICNHCHNAESRPNSMFCLVDGTDHEHLDVCEDFDCVLLHCSFCGASEDTCVRECAGVAKGWCKKVRVCTHCAMPDGYCPECQKAHHDEILAEAFTVQD